MLKKDLENTLLLVEHIIDKVIEPLEHTPENEFDFYFDEFVREDENSLILSTTHYPVSLK